MARPPRKKKAIERAALELFAETGIDGTSIRMIAERAGVTEGALYRHHASKDDLVRALFFDYFERFALLLEAAAQREAPFDARLTAMISGFLAACDEDPQAFHFVLTVQHSLLDGVRKDMANPIEAVMALIRRAIDAGQLPDQDVALSAQMLLGIVMQVAVGHRYGRVEGPLEQRTPEVASACLRVLRHSV